MSKKNFAALILLAATGLPAAHAVPEQDELGNFLLQRGLIARLGDTIQQATDRAADLMKNAMGALGVPYRMGGTSAETGFDCSGFVRAMFQQSAGLMLPRTAADQAKATSRIKKTDLKPGDLVFFNTRRRSYSHVGIYMGEGKFIHSPRSGSHVRMENMNIRYWQTRFNGARRVLTNDQTAKDTTPAAPRVIDRDSPAPAAVRLGGGLFGKPGNDGPRNVQDSVRSGSI